MFEIRKDDTYLDGKPSAFIPEQYIISESILPIGKED